MKYFKRFGAILFTLIMLSTIVSNTAYAATPTIDSTKTSGTLTVTKAGSTFTIYKLFRMTLPPNSGAYEYGTTGTGIDTYMTTHSITAEDVSKYTPAEQDSFIAGLQNYIKNYNSSNPGNMITGIESLQDSTTGNAVFSNLALGYYLVTETGTDNTQATVASKSFLVSVPSVVSNGTTSSWNYDVTATPKDSQATINKVIEKSGDVLTATQKIGDVVNYRLEADIPTYDATATGIEYYITDSMSKGLTLNTVSGVAVKGISSGAETTLTPASDYYTVSVDTTSITGTSIKITFDYEKIKDYSKVKVNYSATLNEAANIGREGNPNDVSLAYTSNPFTHTIYKDTNHETIVYTTGIAINKEDDVTRQDLAGAVFELKDFNTGNVLAVYTYDAAGNARVLSSNGVAAATDAAGMTYFIGLNEGTYLINEKVAPAGYSLIPEPVKITITASKDGLNQYNGEFTYQYAFVSDTSAPVTYNTTQPTEIVTKGSDIYVKVNILDHAGFTLPGTGGVGTVIFMVSGISIIMLGVIMLIIYRVKHKAGSAH